ncbi:MAG: nucleotidyl transferase AbiEii/AbiGii toxin family protein [Patescibacteria group bacterium]
MNAAFFIETLPSDTKVLLEKFQHSIPSFLGQFYLSGGTALSLQTGHRESEDLDFFTQKPFHPEKLQESL